MQNKTLLTLSFISLIFSLFSQNFEKNEKIQKADFFVGEKLPFLEREMEATDGNNYKLQNLKKEKGLLLIFSCNTCPFVVGSDSFSGWEKDYNDLHKKALEANVEMVLVNSNEAFRNGVDSMDEMKKHAEKQKYTMKYLVDKDHKLADALSAKTTPHVYLFDKDLNLIYKGLIDDSYDPRNTNINPLLIDALQSVKENKTLPVQESASRGCSIKRLK